jgi:hypothetical protein
VRHCPIESLGREGLPGNFDQKAADYDEKKAVVRSIETDKYETE